MNWYQTSQHTITLEIEKTNIHTTAPTIVKNIRTGDVINPTANTSIAHKVIITIPINSVNVTTSHTTTQSLTVHWGNASECSHQVYFRYYSFNDDNIPINPDGIEQ